MSDDQPEAHAAGPERIGPYRILAKIGEGGFGVVYEAEQHEPVRRRVAVKIIKPGMDSEAVVARFEAERQALAVMDHPCIAKIIDGGMTGPELGSRPYFVMELVKGVPITEHCDTQQLTIDERCELFIKVCEAVQHAHTKGVVHRDLKPSNVLVAYDGDGHAIPKVIDFGVAKALNTRLTEKTIFTERGQLIGTPEYMSPEQAEMSGQDIDTRADVYSLGVLLYELLTGVLPFDPKTLREAAFAEIQRIIRETDPPKPSTKFSTMLHSGDAAERVKKIVKARKADAKAITGVLKRDLDWVIMRSLEKDRARRYATSQLLADEMSGYLNGLPVMAGPPSKWYSVTKFIGRHRALVLTGTTVTVTLAASAIATTAAYLDSQALNRRLEEERIKLQTSVDRYTILDILSNVKPIPNAVERVNRSFGHVSSPRFVIDGDQLWDGVEKADQRYYATKLLSQLGLVHSLYATPVVESVPFELQLIADQLPGDHSGSIIVTIRLKDGESLKASLSKYEIEIKVRFPDRTGYVSYFDFVSQVKQGNEQL